MYENNDNMFEKEIKKFNTNLFKMNFLNQIQKKYESKMNDNQTIGKKYIKFIFIYFSKNVIKHKIIFEFNVY